MAKNKIIILCILCFFINNYSIGQNALRDKLEEVYLSQIGVRELTGNNDGKDVEKFLRSVGFDKGFAWCAAFISWCYIESEIEAVKSAWSPDWFPEDKLTNNPQKGDVGGIYHRDKKRIAHVLIIHRWLESDFCITVEGNTNKAGSREGDGVLKKRRLKKQIYKISSFI